jgi:hypothetical protein
MIATKALAVSAANALKRLAFATALLVLATQVEHAGQRLKKGSKRKEII